MTWLLAGGTACAVLVVLAGFWIGRTMRALDRLADSQVAAPADSTVQSPAVPGPRRSEPERCECGVENCLLRPVPAGTTWESSGTEAF